MPARSAMCTRRRILLVDANGAPRRIDKAFSWEYPFAAHGMLQSVIRNAWAGDPYPIDTLFLFMANMGWNSAMNTTADAAHAVRSRSGERRVPNSTYHLRRRLRFGNRGVRRSGAAGYDLSGTPRLHLACWIARFPMPTAQATRSASRWWTPDRDVRPFQDVLLDLGARLGLPGMTSTSGAPKYPARLRAIHGRTRTRAGRRPARRLARRAMAASTASANRIRTSLKYTKPIIATGTRKFPPPAAITRWRTATIWPGPSRSASSARPTRSCWNCIRRRLQKFRLAAQGHGAQQPPDRERERVANYFDPLPFWYATTEASSNPLPRR